MSSISARSGRIARLLATAATASLALGLAAGAQDGEDEDEPAVDPAALCGVGFAQSGAASNVEYAGIQLASCDALLVSAHTASELLAAEDKIVAAHEHVLTRWQAVNQELVEIARMPGLPPLRDDDDEESMEEAEADEDAAVEDDAAADTAEAEAEEDVAEAETDAEAAPTAPVVDPNNPWEVKRAERHAVETGMDGLRILMRLANQLAERYADPLVLAAALPGPAATRAADVLSEREVCASAGRVEVRNLPALPPSWYAFAEFRAELDDDGEEITPAVFYEIEVVDDVAAIAEAYLAEELVIAPGLGVTSLRSYDTKDDCSNSEFPSEDPEES